MSDKWRGYDPLVNHPQYNHLTVNHSINFIDPTTGAHTQNIERSWRDVRSNIPRFGRSEDHMAGYLAEYCWKKSMKEKIDYITF